MQTCFVRKSRLLCFTKKNKKKVVLRLQIDLLQAKSLLFIRFLLKSNPIISFHFSADTTYKTFIFQNNQIIIFEQYVF
jgi:hypothetical protein